MNPDVRVAVQGAAARLLALRAAGPAPGWENAAERILATAPVWIGARHAALPASTAGEFVDTACVTSTPVRIYEPGRAPYAEVVVMISLRLLSFAPFDGAVPFWGSIRSAGRALPDFVHVVARDVRSEALKCIKRPQFTIRVGSTDFGVAELRSARLAYAIARSRRGAIASVGSSLYAVVPEARA